jgi:hypothetical protein
VYPCVLVIAENNWSIPNVQELFSSKASKLRSTIRDIKNQNSTDTSTDDDSTSYFFKPLPRRRPSSHSNIVYTVPVSTSEAPLRKEYDARAKVQYTTESGVVLPWNALAYGHIPLTQFKGNTVQRLDVGIPLTYTLKHLPLARTVPMLKVSETEE